MAVKENVREGVESQVITKVQKDSHCKCSGWKQ